ncbi:NAD(FAD)-utilizing dehydrogenase [Candidatus Syntrophocurvum alkaliphilum]|uniref:NAD(FAD)-utilizing dehydrogenase n=1 Tax=Candidatus Syntrophocurvum alkaliphilum TaxID=2293317 RepID=A0A6I6DEL3_9FIRM|nr:hypothetical protein [Candidatus Syntrophocurvum alkaliphilum]QGU00882.1 NAD(FAD)-utilizing dehydrogenase [Candidatus Syntrophocurvum alkaliphilum]
MYRVRGLKLKLEHKKQDILIAVAKKMRIDRKDIENIKIVRKAVDARKKEIYFTYTVDVQIKNNTKIKGNIIDGVEVLSINYKEPQEILEGNQKLPYAPVIIGSGPAGLFCGLFLARQGFKPIVLEQGLDVDNRVKKVENFWQRGNLDKRSNTQFGEGGAGTFSDGKLTTRIGDERVDYVLKTFIEYGASEEIACLKKPHVGTDIIRNLVKKIRNEIVFLGGQVYFNAKMTDVNINDNNVKSIIINREIEIPCNVLVLAIGNSARDVFRLLYNKGIRISPKPFAVGVRVEHLQDEINKKQYGEYANHPSLEAADYHLTYKDKETNRSLYTFCMCPGGYVIGAASDQGQVVTNGMSYYKRDSGIANSALVVTVKPEDWGNETLGGIKYQEDLEVKAYKMGGENYNAPAQKLIDFLNKTPTTSLENTIATYTPGIKPSNLWNLFPEEINSVLHRGITYWGTKMETFVDERAVLTGVETRTSSPIRIERDKKTNISINTAGLYPCGEGAGYAGGIVSAAVDGLRIAENIIITYAKPLETTTLSHKDLVNAKDI